MTLKSHDLAHIRSVVLAGHAGSGKTTLAEQLLFRAGAIPRLGKVDDGTAHLDYEPEEQKQHRSLSLAVGTFERGEHEVCRRLEARIAKLLQWPVDHGEGLQVHARSAELRLDPVPPQQAS